MTERRELKDGQAWLRARLERGVHPLDGMDPDSARATIAQLRGLEPEPWTEAWGALSDRYAAAARHAGATADRRDALMQAYRAAFMGRYPTPQPSAQAAHVRPGPGAVHRRGAARGSAA